MKKNQIFVISLGGSVICPRPDKIDVKFLRRFENLILKLVRKGNKFIILTGGGKVCRLYQKSALKFENISNETLDWLGIQVTKLNAFFLKSIFGKKAKILSWEKISSISKLKSKILIAGGWKPGKSTDYDAVFLAKKFKVKELINLSDIPYIFTKNPKIYKDAKPIKKAIWEDFQKLVGKKWKPGLSVPFDPLATNLAKKLKMRVYFLKGNNVKNLENFFSGKKFKGTIVE